MKKKTKKLPRPQKSRWSIREGITDARLEIARMKRERVVDKRDLREIARDVAFGTKRIAQQQRVLERLRAALPKAIKREKATARRAKKAAKVAARKALAGKK